MYAEDIKMINLEKIKFAMNQIIEAIGEDSQREGLLDTPERVAKMYSEIFSGLEEEPKKYLETVFNSDYKGPILVKNIQFYSMCEHHFVPFIGKASIAYIPHNGIVTGLSKIARVVDCIAKRPQLQERLTVQIADALMDGLNPEGVIVLVKAEHLCMSMRGIKKPNTHTVTCVSRGVFEEDQIKRKEIIKLINEV